jgi:pimeloyl-ACP methyl ester carboxylesterase
MTRRRATAALAFLLAPPVFAQTRDGAVSQRYYLSLTELRHRYATSASRYTLVDGVEVHYKDEGRGPVLLLVHGSSSTMQTWDKVVPLLRPHYRVIRYDVPGQGLSADVPDAVAATTDPADIAEQLLARLGVSKVTAIGVSSGGTLVEYLAAKRPDLVDRLIVSNAPSDPVDTSHLRATPEWAAAQADARLSGVKGPAFWGAFLTYYAGNGRRIDARTRAAFAAFNDRQPSRNAIALIAKVADHDKAAAAFAAIKAPTLLIWGARDKLLPPSAARTLANYLKETDPSIVYLPDVGHFPPIETPARFASIVRAWLEAGVPQ